MNKIQSQPNRKLGLFACLFAVGMTPLPAGAECSNTNTCLGLNALPTDSGANNTAIGYQALKQNSSGEDNTALGANALGANATGSGNIAIGDGAMSSATSSNNIAIGVNALLTGGAGGDLVIGNNALSGDDFHTAYSGHSNIAIGFFALQMAQAGEDNIAFGHRAMAGTPRFPNAGSRNIAIGRLALRGNHLGNDNTAIGYQAMQGFVAHRDEGDREQNGHNNTAYGTRTLFNNHNGSFNTATGTEALVNNIDGNNNTATGGRALRGLSTGARNVAMGQQAGAALVTGSDNIIIGASNTGVAVESHVIRIGKSPNQNKAYVAGIRGVQTGLPTAAPVMIDANGQLGTLRSSRAVKEDIRPMGDVSDRLFQLQPVTFRYKQAYEDGSKPVQFGLVAEEVAEVFPELVVRDASGKVETVSYHQLSSLLVNELQKEHRVNESQAARIALLETQVAEIAELKSALADMVQTVEQLNLARLATN